MFTIEEIAKSYVGCDVEHPEYSGFVISICIDRIGIWWIITKDGQVAPIESTWLPTVIERYAYGLDVA